MQRGKPAAAAQASSSSPAQQCIGWQNYREPAYLSFRRLARVMGNKRGPRPHKRRREATDDDVIEQDQPEKLVRALRRRELC